MGPSWERVGRPAGAEQGKEKDGFVGSEEGEIGQLDLWRPIGGLRILHFLELMHRRIPCELRSYPS
uniref:Uncharacterized protein n=1 Tax=Rhizophora mucronata TaxID=61149 RepID=A0A2P2J5F8_RHIMU